MEEKWDGKLIHFTPKYSELENLSWLRFLWGIDIFLYEVPLLKTQLLLNIILIFLLTR